MDANVLVFDEITAEQQRFAGGKGASLARLYQAGFPVPPGFVILPSAFDAEDLTIDAWLAVQQHLTKMRSAYPQIAFAVRSSALSEDSTNASFAGEFESVLNVRSDADIHEAILHVYNSRKSERVQAYSQGIGIDSGHQVAVVVQQLVEAVSAGVLFTANPVSGERGEVMLTATWGFGEAIVGGKVTPDTLVVNKQTGCIVSVEIGDKQVMTVRLKDGTTEQPVPEQQRRAPVLSDHEVGELVRLGTRIEAMYGMPMDIEWVSARGTIEIVQARPITTLVEEALPAPTTWNLPKGQYAAMRNNIVELMPNPLTPLFDTLGRKVINKSLGRLLTQSLGLTGVLSEDLIISVNGYAYNNGSVRPLKLFAILLDTGGILKRMFTGAIERWTEVGKPGYIAAIEGYQAMTWKQWSSTDLLIAAGNLFEAAIDAYGALISGVIPASWMTEALFTRFYNTMIKRRGDSPAQAFLLGFDSAPILAEKALFDLAEWVRGYPGLMEYLSRTPASQLAKQIDRGIIPPEVNEVEWQDWQTHFQAYLKYHGHMIYNLDFSNPVPADNPTPLLETCQMFIRGEGTNPYTRQARAANQREQVQQSALNRIKGMRLKYFRRFLEAAQRYVPLREDGLSDVGLGYPLLRQFLLELGRRFSDNGMIEKPEDIFWVNLEEAEGAAACLDRGEVLASAAAVVRRRKAIWRAARQVTPPMMLPQMKVLGFDLARLKSRRARKLRGNTIKGVAASPGIVTGPACVLSVPEDFPKLKTGDVLVAAITTPAWTPLFARASAVVTDVGGPLSHGSIVAREYGIPAVLGTGNATQRIHDGQRITVDGGKGTVVLNS